MTQQFESEPRLTSSLKDNEEYEPSISHELFKLRSFDLLAKELIENPEATYPATRLTNALGCASSLPSDLWNTRPDETVQEDVPTHPWLDDMLKRRDIGVVTGRGLFYNTGANKTADPAITRRVNGRTAILLVQRTSGLWALPGGFVDPGESSHAAALREAHEETGLYMNQYEFMSQLLYRGPVADVRMTAHAWPETSLYGIQILTDFTPDLPEVGEPYVVGDEGTLKACWFYPKDIPIKTFGSHALMISVALGQEI